MKKPRRGGIHRGYAVLGQMSWEADVVISITRPFSVRNLTEERIDINEGTAQNPRSRVCRGLILNTKNLFPGFIKKRKSINNDVILFPVGLVVKRLLEASSSLCCLRYSPF